MLQVIITAILFYNCLFTAIYTANPADLTTKLITIPLHNRFGLDLTRADLLKIESFMSHNPYCRLDQVIESVFLNLTNQNNEANSLDDAIMYPYEKNRTINEPLIEGHCKVFPDETININVCSHLKRADAQTLTKDDILKLIESKHKDAYIMKFSRDFISGLSIDQLRLFGQHLSRFNFEQIAAIDPRAIPYIVQHLTREQLTNLPFPQLASIYPDSFSITTLQALQEDFVHSSNNNQQSVAGGGAAAEPNQSNIHRPQPRKNVIPSAGNVTELYGPKDHIVFGVARYKPLDPNTTWNCTHVSIYSPCIEETKTMKEDLKELALQRQLTDINISEIRKGHECIGDYLHRFSVIKGADIITSLTRIAEINSKNDSELNTRINSLKIQVRELINYANNAQINYALALQQNNCPENTAQIRKKQERLTTLVSNVFRSVSHHIQTNNMITISASTRLPINMFARFIANLYPENPYLYYIFIESLMQSIAENPNISFAQHVHTFAERNNINLPVNQRYRTDDTSYLNPLPTTNLFAPNAIVDSSDLVHIDPANLSEQDIQNITNTDLYNDEQRIPALALSTEQISQLSRAQIAVFGKRISLLPDHQIAALHPLATTDILAHLTNSQKENLSDIQFCHIPAKEFIVNPALSSIVQYSRQGKK